MAQPRKLPSFRLLSLLGASSLAFALTTCSPTDSALENYVNADALVVAMPLNTMFYRAGAAPEDFEGFDYELVNLFAGSLKRSLRIVPVHTVAEMHTLLTDHLVDFAAGFPVENESPLKFSQTLQTAAAVVVQSSNRMKLVSAEALAGKTVDVAYGSYAKGLLPLFATKAEVQEVPAANEIDLLARVADGRSTLAFTDSLHYSLAVNFYPDIDIALELPQKINFAWAFVANNNLLRDKADAFITQLKDDGTISRLVDRYYGHVTRVGAYDMAQFLNMVRIRLPRYRAYFHEAQTLTGIDWRLLAALAYQESQWNPLATSFTGVRGMMMLTEDTADRLNVANRLDPRESITAGARYLADLMDMNRAAPLPDRTWLALSAYNLGPGHFNNARIIARNLKRDPTSWFEMKHVLPLLARPEYYKKLANGRGRGGEAVVMVENIRNFYDVLTRFEPAYEPVIEPMMRAAHRR